MTVATTMSDQAMPEFWPASAGPARVRPIWIPWLIAVVLAPLFWLFPRRLGPHFAAAGWRAAIASHLLWGIYGAATITMTELFRAQYGLITWLAHRTPEQTGASMMPVPTLSEILRAPLASWIGMAVIGSGAPRAWPMLLLGPLMIVLMLEAGVVLLSLLLMPYLAAGERTRFLFGRTVRLVMWATTSVVVLGRMLQGLVLVHPEQDWVFSLVILAYVIWAVRLMIRGGSRYTGPAEGPAWQQRTPACEQCGYTLTALPLAASCPECGLAVAESLPDRRQPSRFAAATSAWSRCKAYLPTLWAVLVDKSFFRRLRMQDAHSAACRFALWTYAAVTIVTWLTSYADAWLWEGARWREHGNTLQILGDMAGSFGWFGPGFLVMGGLLALIACRFGSQDVQRPAVAVFYCSAWLLPIWVSLILTFNLVIWLGGRAYFKWVVLVPGIGRLDLYEVLVVLPVAVPLVVACRSIARLIRGVNQTRHANA